MSEQAFRSATQETVYAAFYEGDLAILTIGTSSKNTLKEVGFGLYESTEIYSARKQVSVQKEILIRRTGVYSIVVQPGGLVAKEFTVKLERRPSEAAPPDFRTDVNWVTTVDTLFRNVPDLRLVSLDTNTVILYESKERMNSMTNLGGSSIRSIPFQLPEDVVEMFQKKTTLGWGYEIAVGEVGEKAFDKFCEVAASVLSEIPTPSATLASMVLGKLPALRNAPEGEAIAFQFEGVKEGRAVLIRQGKTALAAGPVLDVTQGPIKLVLSNENVMQGLNVQVRVVAVVVSEQHEVAVLRVPYTEEKSVPHVYKTIPRA